MINIQKNNNNYFIKTIEFLKSVPSIESIDEEILKNACIAIEDNKIIGCISFEEFSNKGLIRYFVFKKALNLNYLELLLNQLEKYALTKEVNEFVCIAENDQIKELFRSLDFIDLIDNDIFLDEENVINTNFKSSVFLKKQLI